MKKNKPQLTISLLASNRPDTLHRCLDSLRPIMERISCELILIDTSKNPQVHEILLEYTDQVYEFEWCNDFAKARNEGLKRANGEWFLFLDDDEWFVETDALIDFFQSGEYRQYGYANYKVRNFRDSDYVIYSDSWLLRMVRLEEDTHFASRIHEYLTPLRGARKDINAMVYHSGYIYETMEDIRAHFERNSALLLALIEEEPHNLHAYTHLAQEYHYVGEWEQLELFCRKSLKHFKEYAGAYESIYMGAFFVGLVTGLISQKKYEESIQICKEVLEEKRNVQVLNAFMHLKLAESYFRAEQWDDAIEQANIYIQILKSIDHKDSMVIEQTFVPIAGEAFGSNYQITAYSVLICSELEKGSTKALCRYYDKLCWKQSVVYRIEGIEQYLVKVMWTLPYERIFTTIIEDAFRNGPLRLLFCKEILLWKGQAVNTFQTVLYRFVEAIQAVVDGPKSGDLLGYQDALKQYVQETCEWYDFVQTQAECDSGELPEYMLAAVKISEYVELELQDKIQALGRLKDAVELFPEFADGIGGFLDSYVQLEEQRAGKQKKEMEALRIQVIQQIKIMLENGQVQAASQIVGQLKQMFPGDLEVVQLEWETQLKGKKY